MIILTMLNGKRISTRIGQGKIADPAKVARLEADNREAEVILINAPYLREHNGNFHYWEGIEATGAALAFNYHEKPTKR